MKTRSLHAAIAAATVLVATAACTKKDTNDAPSDPAQSYGEPVGMRMSGSNPGDPTYEIAFAVNKGKLPPAPGVMGGPVYVAAKSCPAVKDVTKNGQSLRLKVVLEKGVVRVPQMPDEPAGACLLKGIEGKTIPKIDADALDVLIELRAPEGAS